MSLLHTIYKILISALAIFPILPTISDTENRALVLIAEFIGIVIFQVYYQNELEASRFVSMNLWCTFMIKTLLAISELFSHEPPNLVIYLSWGSLILTFVTPIYERVIKCIKSEGEIVSMTNI